MEKLFYPAVFHTAEEGGYWVEFPDIPECLTEGDTLEKAYDMATDALGLALTERLKSKEELPDASTPVMPEDGFVAIVAFDLMSYNKKERSRAIKKTLSIPEWMNEEALALNINFSQVLQDALVEKINAKDNM